MQEQKQFFEQLTETIVWCERMGSVKQLETSVRMFKLECSNLYSQQSRVWLISFHWSKVICSNGLADLPPVTDLRGGRLLAYFPGDNLADGCAQANSEGFFDIDNIPPYDTWVWMVDDRRIDKLADGTTRKTEGSYLVAWVPPAFLELASLGIDVKPEECILSLDTLDHPFVQSLRRLKLVA